MWEGVLGYNLHTTSKPGADPNDVHLAIAVSRGGAIVLFALCSYAIMLVLGFCAVVMGVLTFINVRPPETGLIGSLAAFAFALPVLRGILPGSPPLGVTADMWVFLWAEMVNRAGACARGLQMGACRSPHLRRGDGDAQRMGRRTLTKYGRPPPRQGRPASYSKRSGCSLTMRA